MDAADNIRRLKAAKPKKKVGRKMFSQKRTELNKEYKKQSKLFLATHPICQIQAPGCTGKAQGVHHKAGRVGKMLMNIIFWLSACNHCNLWIETHDKEAREKGFKVSKFKKV